MIAALLLAAQAAPVASCKVTLPAGLAISVETAEPLSSKTKAKGDMVALRTREDVRIDDRLAIPKDTAVVGQIADARSTGGLGVSGRLEVRALYIQIGGSTIRLTGAMGEKGNLPIASILALQWGLAVSGRSATIAAGAPVPAIVLKPVTVEVAGGC